MQKNIKIEISFFNVLDSPLSQSLNFFPSGLHAETFKEDHYKLILFSINYFFDRSGKTRSSIGCDSSFNTTETFPKHFISVFPDKTSRLFLILSNVIIWWKSVRINIFIIDILWLLRISNLRSVLFGLYNTSEFIIFHSVGTESSHILSSRETVDIRKSMRIGKWCVDCLCFESCNRVHLV